MSQTGDTAKETFQRSVETGLAAGEPLAGPIVEGHLGPMGERAGENEERMGGDNIEREPPADGDSVSMSPEDPLEDEEGDAAKVRRVPKGPTQREREEHEATHIPYRSWCKHCVRGRAPNRPHRAAPKEEDEEERERRVPRISMDYFFMGQEGEKASECPMLVMVDESTGNCYMRAVGRKGLGEGREMEWLVRDMSEELKSWGHPGGSMENSYSGATARPASRRSVTP